MKNNYRTERLELDALTREDVLFMAALVNTPEWMQFIGDRNIRTLQDAGDYIQRILDNPDMNYWVVRLADKRTPIGIITFMKRDYLEHYDIGFAFLSAFTHKGYAQEAATAVMNDITRHPSHTHILAITVKENTNSIKLLEKLGLGFATELRRGNDLLWLYAASVDKLLIHQLTDQFYSLFTNADQQVPALENIHAICLPGTLIIKKDKETETVYDLTSFIEPRKQILSDGTLTGFREYQVFEETKVVGNMAQRFSRYQKRGYMNGAFFEAKGNKLFQYVKTSQGWQIAAVMWEDENG